jgi:hypothetical protein
MIRMAIGKLTSISLLGSCAMLVFAAGQTSAQTTTPTTPAPAVKPKPPAKPVVPAKPVAAAKPVVAPASPASAAKPVVAPASPASPAAKQTPVNTPATATPAGTAATAAKPATSTAPAAASSIPAATTSTVAPNGTGVLSNIPTIPGTSSVLPNSSAAPASNSYTGAAPASTGYTGVAPEGQRSAVLASGLHDFHAYDYTLTAYGCFRNGTRLFCDFDTSKINATQVGSNIWGPINLVDDGGKVTARHNAFFLFDDGTQAPTAYLSTKPVRFIIEYDDVNPRFTQVALVLGGDRALGIPVTAVDPNQPGGAAIPARGGAVQQAQGQPQATAPSTPAAPGTQAATPANVTDQANQAINNANNKKAQAQSLWQTLKAAAAAQKPATPPPATPPPPKP